MLDEGLKQQQAGIAQGGPTSQQASGTQPPVQLTYEERVERMKRFYSNFVRSEAGFLKLSQILTGEIEPPWIKLSFPASSKDVDGSLVMVEVDLLAAARRLTTNRDAADSVVHQVLEPLYRYLYVLYRDDLLGVANEANLAVNELLEQETAPGGAHGS